MQENSMLKGVRVPLVEEADAEGRLADLYEDVKTATGLPFVPDMFRLTSTRPELLHVVTTGYAGMFKDGALARETKELIAAWTSQVNQCPYCVGTHNWFLLQFGGSPELAAAVETATTPEELPLDERTLALMRLVTKVSTAAYQVTDADWAAPADAGWSDDEILEAVFCAALFNFINRLVDSVGLGAALQQKSRISQQESTR
ncbi:carboxymuconolactone decarboxylase family protein [Spirillospora sp. NBC_01491]|uniref:carboxymuconolactone decarboxylase family protein n=1 Tax=Spirillospora sp. NBC_01491 TaxID=2976007 RepID=UPI002E3616A5|nr:peroxidase-related enzyme [Spirillospora sp. NBC_01491]